MFKIANSLDIQKVCEKYNVTLEWDSDKNCFYLEDAETDEQLTPCLQNYFDLEEWINKNLDDLLKKIRKSDEEGDVEEDRKESGT